MIFTLALLLITAILSVVVITIIKKLPDLLQQLPLFRGLLLAKFHNERRLGLLQAHPRLRMLLLEQLLESTDLGADDDVVSHVDIIPIAADKVFAAVRQARSIRLVLLHVLPELEQLRNLIRVVERRHGIVYERMQRLISSGRNDMYTHGVAVSSMPNRNNTPSFCCASSDWK